MSNRHHNAHLMITRIVRMKRLRFDAKIVVSGVHLILKWTAQGGAERELGAAASAKPRRAQKMGEGALASGVCLRSGEAAGLERCPAHRRLWRSERSRRE